MRIFILNFFIGDFYSSDDTEFIRRFPAAAITHGFSRMRPVRSLQIPPEVGKSPTDLTDLHRFFIGIFSSDDTEFIRRFPAAAITHGFSRMRPVRSLQIPPEVGKSPTDLTDLHRFFIGIFSSDDTEFIRRFPAAAITHGFSRMRPVRSLQIPPETGQRDLSDIP